MDLQLLPRNGLRRRRNNQRDDQLLRRESTVEELLCPSGPEEGKASGSDHVEVARYTEVGEGDPHRARACRAPFADPASSLRDTDSSDRGVDHAVLTQSPAESDEAVIGRDHDLADTCLTEPRDSADELRLDGFEPLPCRIEHSRFACRVDLLGADEHDSRAADRPGELLLPLLSDPVEIQIDNVAVCGTKERHTIGNALHRLGSDGDDELLARVQPDRQPSVSPGTEIRHTHRRDGRRRNDGRAELDFGADGVKRLREVSADLVSHRVDPDVRSRSLVGCHKARVDLPLPYEIAGVETLCLQSTCEVLEDLLEPVLVDRPGRRDLRL
jgi:hypothetical protein